MTLNITTTSMIIGITGKKRSGKDTSADYIIENYDFEKKLSIADPLKEACRILFGFNDEQLYGEVKDAMDPYWKCTPRDVFQYLGTDILRNDIKKIIPNIGNNFFLNLLTRKIEENAETQNIVVADLRFQNEIDKIHDLGGIIIKVTRPNLVSETTHESEDNDKLKDIDYVMINDGSKETLYKRIDDIMSLLCLKKS
jgi:hypothetical protein